MSDLRAIPAPPVPALPVAGTEASFPVRRVYCVGRNYAAHAREMGDTGREPPFFFCKPADAVFAGTEASYPPATSELHHEVELVVALRGGGAHLRSDQALEQVFGYAVGIDLTRRDLQRAAKKNGRPWDMAKGFDQSGPCSAIRTATDVGHPTAGSIDLAVNGEPRQHGDLADMIWSVPEVIAHLSRLVRLAPGDLIFTGTPAGVGPLTPGDSVLAQIAGVGSLEIVIASTRE
jgi:fumarylpyruvate hydrolase